MDKAELIRHEIEKRRDHNLAIGNPLFVAMAEEDIELLLFIDSIQEEPVSEDLEEAAKDFVSAIGEKYIDSFYFPELEYFYKAGAKWQENHLWKSAEGLDLPIFDREVIVLIQRYPLEGSEYAVSFAHRPYKGKYIGKNLTTGNIETFENKTYGKGGWSIPDVKWWLDCGWPNKEERDDS